MASSTSATRPSSVPARWDGTGLARAGRNLSLWDALASISPIDGPRHLYPRGDVELAEQVAHVGFDGLDAEEQLGGDLGVGLAVDDEPCHLELALRERLEAAAIRHAGSRAAMDVVALLSQLAFRGVAVARRAAVVERGGRACERGRSPGDVAGLRERAPGKCQ